MSKSTFYCCMLPISLLLYGCGVITAPVSGPKAIASNTNFDLVFEFLDSDGQQIADVNFQQTLNHRFWHPITGYKITNEVKKRPISNNVHVRERGESIQFDASRSGSVDSRLWINASAPDIIESTYGRWRYAPGFPIVLVPNRPDVDMRILGDNIDLMEYPHQPVFKLPMLWGPGTFPEPRATRQPQLIRAGFSNTFVVLQPPSDISRLASGREYRSPWEPIGVQAIDIVDVGSTQMTPGTFYMTVTPPSPTPEDLRVRIPASLHLHVAGQGNGLIRMQTKLGFVPILVSDRAPSEGYSDLSIDRARLQEMRASHDLLLEGREYFFIKAEGHYGKGCISWLNGVDSTLRVFVWMQAKEADTNLTWHHGYVR